jgi:predicted RNA-binding protein (virulence factor B family)
MKIIGVYYGKRKVKGRRPRIRKYFDSMASFKRAKRGLMKKKKIVLRMIGRTSY